MELEKAKEILNDCVEWDTFGRSVRSKKNKLDNKCFKALEIVMKELDRLQKENEKYECKIILSDEEYRKLIDEAQKDCISKDKIREKIKELKEMLKKTTQGRPQKYTPGAICLFLSCLEDLLKEE